VANNVDPNIVNTLPTRSQYLAGMNMASGDRPDGYRWAVINIWRLNSQNMPENVIGEPLAFYTDFIFQDTTKIDRERVQIFPSSHDSGKSFFFDREFRQYSFQGFVYDVPLKTGVEERDLLANGATRFNYLYENVFRLSQAAKKRIIIELDMDKFRLWGAMTNKVLVHASDTPVMYTVTFGFWVEALQLKETMTGNPQNLFISKESAYKLSLAQDAVEAPPPIDNGVEQQIADALRVSDRAADDLLLIDGGDTLVIKP
jgi:hypothetical protein